MRCTPDCLYIPYQIWAILRMLALQPLAIYSSGVGHGLKQPKDLTDSCWPACLLVACSCSTQLYAGGAGHCCCVRTASGI
jgi:hypothetical protein